MEEIRGFIMATNAEPVSLILDTRPNEFPDVHGRDLVTLAQAHYAAQAARFVAILERHAAGGFYDAIFAELCRRKASIFSVSHEDNPNKAR